MNKNTEKMEIQFKNKFEIKNCNDYIYKKIISQQ